jgi:hypothetical protein
VSEWEKEREGGRERGEGVKVDGKGMKVDGKGMKEEDRGDVVVRKVRFSGSLFYST